jgi:hypothetical protein
MQTTNWIPTLIGKYQQALTDIKPEWNRMDILSYLSNLNLENGICNYIEKENLVHHKETRIVDEKFMKSSVVYRQLQDYMKVYYPNKAYFCLFPSLAYSTDQIKTSIKTRLQHLHKMDELYKQA